MSQENTTTRIPALDGWRGIAILLVLLDHTQAALIGGYYRPWLQTGQHGVTIFFVLSGYLITSKLLQGPIDLKSFYLRRFFRLMPVAWIYLASLWVTGELSGLHWISGREIASCVFFYRNFFGPTHKIYASHFWSLSIEEQFYLVWPCLLLFAGIRRSRWFAICGALAIASYRLLHWAAYDSAWVSFRTEVRADALLAGCLLALLLADARMRAEIQRWTRYIWLPALAALLFCIGHYPWLPPLYECLAIAVLIASAVLHPQSILVRPLILAPLTWLGTVSYSVYVWQEFFLVHLGPATIPLICIMPLFVLGSYYFIERPSARFGHRLIVAPRSSRETLRTHSQPIET